MVDKRAIRGLVSNVFGLAGIGVTSTAIANLPAGTSATTLAVANQIPTMQATGLLVRNARAIDFKPRKGMRF